MYESHNFFLASWGEWTAWDCATNGEQSRSRSCQNPDGPQAAQICAAGRDIQIVECEITPGTVTLKIKDDWNPLWADTNSGPYRTLSKQIEEQILAQMAQDEFKDGLAASTISNFEVSAVQQSADGEVDVVLTYDEHKPTDTANAEQSQAEWIEMLKGLRGKEVTDVETGDTSSAGRTSTGFVILLLCFISYFTK